MNQQNPRLIRVPKAPPANIAYAHKLGRGMLTLEQIDELVKAINPNYVETKQRLTYLAQHQARAEMNRIFGYANWSVRAEEPVLMYEFETPGTGQNASKTYWRVGYRIMVTVEIRDLWGMPVAEFTGVHAEQNAPQPDRGEAHALALTSVDSYALRRALINLGDRFGLGLYAGGSVASHGQYTQQLFPGQLFDYVDPTTTRRDPVPVAPAVTHETVVATPSVYVDGVVSEPQQAPQPTQRGGMEEFHQAQEVLQERRQGVRAQQAGTHAPVAQGNYAIDPNMAARLQAGLKTDGSQN